MRLLKRVLIAGLEVGVLVIGFFLSIAVAAWVDSLYSELTAWAYFSCLGVAFLGFLMILRRTRKWKLNYDADGWRIDRSERQLNPANFQRKRAFVRTILWIPSGLAAFILFLFPISTHVLHPRSRYLAGYEVPISWTSPVFWHWNRAIEAGGVTALVNDDGFARFGFTSFWQKQSRFSLMVFESIRTDAATFEFNYNESEIEHSRATQVSNRTFDLGGVSFDCWQYVPRTRRTFLLREWIGESSPTESLWEVRCETPTNVHRNNLHAYFYGHEGNISTFYSTISRIKPVG